jgi:Ankyrin repeats (3 copies)
VSVQLFAAVKSGSAERVRELLALDPAGVHVKDSEGRTALHYATLNGHREIVGLLLAGGADINGRDDRFHATPTGWAIEYLRENGGLLAIEIEDVLYAIPENDLRWVRRFLTRLPTLARAKSGNMLPSREMTRSAARLRRNAGNRDVSLAICAQHVGDAKDDPRKRIEPKREATDVAEQLLQARPHWAESQSRGIEAVLKDEWPIFHFENCYNWASGPNVRECAGQIECPECPQACSGYVGSRRPRLTNG